MAASMEIKGSRQGTTDPRMRRIARLFVSDDGVTGIPVARDLFPGDSGIEARRVVRVQDTPEHLGGLWYHTVYYAAYVKFGS